MTTTTATTDHAPAPAVDLAEVRRALRRRSFCTLATVSPEGRPHAAGVLYEADDLTLWVNTHRSSRKARNIDATARVGVCVPVRRLPVGPPSSLQFQADAELVAMDDPRVVALLDAGRLRSVTGHGELDEPDGCFVRITPVRRIHTYGIGMPLHRLLRDPLHAAGVAPLA